MKKVTGIFFLLITTISLASTKADHTLWDELLKDHVNENGAVNYKTFKPQQNKLSDYLIELKNNAPAVDWTDKERMAYYINLYNAYTIKFILTKYPVNSAKEARYSGKDIWHLKLVKSGKEIYTLTHLETAILKQIRDPRFYFAINCAAVSCPKLMNSAFTAQNLEESLNRLTKAFINDKNHNIISAKKVKLSKVFEWHYNDFITSKISLIDFINTYSTIKINNDAKVEYLDYNTNLNG